MELLRKKDEWANCYECGTRLVKKDNEIYQSICAICGITFAEAEAKYDVMETELTAQVAKEQAEAAAAAASASSSSNDNTKSASGIVPTLPDDKDFGNGNGSIKDLFNQYVFKQFLVQDKPFIDVDCREYKGVILTVIRTKL